MNGTQYIDAYDKQLNERKRAILQALGVWWFASTRHQGETKARENVSIQIQAMRDYLDELEADLLKAEVTS